MAASVGSTMGATVGPSSDMSGVVTSFSSKVGRASLMELKTPVTLHSGSRLNLAGFLNGCVMPSLFPAAFSLPFLASKGSFLS